MPKNGADYTAHHCNGKTWRGYPSAVCSCHPGNTQSIEVDFDTMDEMWDFLIEKNDIKCPVCENPDDGGPLAWMCTKHRAIARKVVDIISAEFDKEILAAIKAEANKEISNVKE